MEGQKEDDDASTENQFIWSFLKRFQFLSAAKHGKAKLACYIDNARDSGTDHKESVIMKTKTVDVNICQNKCQSHKDCNFFLFLTPETNITQVFGKRENIKFRLVCWKRERWHL